MRLSKNIAVLLMVILITCAFAPWMVSASNDNDSSLKEVGLNWWDTWHRDGNHNKIDDIIEGMQERDRIGIFINYDRHPDKEDVERLSKFDMDVKYVYKYIDVICARNVAVSDVKAISSLPHVVMVKIEPKTYPLLDISAKSIKARESDTYSPNTASDLGFTGKGVSIAVLDSGVDDGGWQPTQHHESLDDLDDNPATTDANDRKRVAGVDFTQDESYFVPRDGTYDPDDVEGHGSHVAGIAMGTGGGGTEYIGMAPQARLVDVKVIENYGAGNAGNSIAGMEWCIDNRNQFNIRILSLSYGTIFGESDGTDEESQVVNKAVEAGLVVVVAIGNDGEQRVTSPAAADGAIAVGSMNDQGTIDRSDDTLSSFSNTGPRLDDGDDDPYDELKPDVVAYGDSIMAPQANSPAAYVSHSGTSMSTPHVSGVIALMLEANPVLNPLQVKDILRRSAEPRGAPSYPDLDSKYNTDYGWGLVDAYKAVEMARGFVEVGIEIDSPSDGSTVKGEMEISGSAFIITGSGIVNSVKVSIDDPDFPPETSKVAEGTSVWSVSWDTNEVENAQHTIYARAWSGNYSAVASVEVTVDNKGSGGDDEIIGEDDTQYIIIGSLKISLLALIAFIAILATIVCLIIAFVLLRRRKTMMEMIKARQFEQGLR